MSTPIPDFTYTDAAGNHYEIFSPEAKEYFSTPGCTCHPVINHMKPSVFIGGQDDCPVHGFEQYGVMMESKQNE